MSSAKNKGKNELAVRRASQFQIDFPQSDILEEKETIKIKNAVNKGGIVIGTKTYIESNKLPTLLGTDKKGVQIVLNKASDEDIQQIGDTDCLSTPEIQKEIAKRKEQPRSELEREKLNYSAVCIDAFSCNSRLNKERAIGADRINQKRPRLGKETIKSRNATKSEISKELLGEGETLEVHHKKRVADVPEEALNPDNLVVITAKEHDEFHLSDYSQDEKGFEEFKKNRK